MSSEFDIKEHIKELDKKSTISRLWKRDYTLWDDQDAEINNRLGWLTAAAQMKTKLEEIEAFSDEIKSENLKYFVLLGMGGSSRAAKVIHRTIGGNNEFPTMVPLESTVPSTIGKALKEIDLKSTLVIVASKSGNTMEPLLTYELFKSEIVKAIGNDEAMNRFVAITDEHSPLHELSVKENFRKVFLNPKDIGGRFSGITYFGLVPAALLGANIGAMIDSGENMRSLCTPENPTTENPGALLGATIGYLAKCGQDKLTLITSPSVFGYGLWVVQLIAESLGKSGKGVIPIAGEPLMKPDHYGDDRFFVYLRLDTDDNKQTDNGIAEIRSNGHPVTTINMSDINSFGAEIFRWEVAISIAASILKVNPFNQPDVQLSKTSTHKILSDLSTSKLIANIESDQVSKLNSYLKSCRPNDYFGLLAYLPHNTSIDQALRSMREKVVRKYKIATTLGHGPSYLHSTGQLHKGGPNSGIFLMLTAPHTDDISIPTKSYTFGQVTDADAIGDLQTLKKLKRRVVHIKLANDSSDAISCLTEHL